LIPLRDYRPSGSFPIVTVSLIVINILVFIYELILSLEPSGLFFGQRLTQQDIFIFRYGVVPWEITHLKDRPPLIPIPIWLTLFTSMFIHAGWLHIIGNMLYLWIFGDNVESAMGRLRFFIFYILSGLAAAMSQILTGPDSQTPMVGASGAIAGVLGAYLLLYPYGRVLTAVFFFYFIRLIYLPAIAVLGLWFLLQFVDAALVRGQAGVAYFAHIGGFIAGALLLFIFKKRDVPIGLFGRRSPWD